MRFEFPTACKGELIPITVEAETEEKARWLARREVRRYFVRKGLKQPFIAEIDLGSPLIYPAWPKTKPES